jgi:hypothetical protein
MIEIFDPNMDTALKWAEEIGPPPVLPKSLQDAEQPAGLIDQIDNKLICDSFLHELDPKEKDERLNYITEIIRLFISDVDHDNEIKNLILRLWAGCMSAAKEIAFETNSGPNTPERRNMIFSKKIDIISESDPVYRAGVEAATAFKRLRNEQYSFEGVPETSSVKKHP